MSIHHHESPAKVVPFAPIARSAALPWWWTASLVTLALSMAAFRLAHTEADPDLWGHLRFGLDTLATGHIDRPDIYSYVTTGVRWINHEWLSELFMAIAWRAAGTTGLIALKTALGLGLAALAAHHLRRREHLSLLAALFITAYGMLMLYPGIRPMRPQAFTYCATAALLWLMEGSARSTDRHARVMWWAVPLMAVWVNLHGAFVAGLGLLGIWWGSRALLAWTDAVLVPSPPGPLSQGRGGVDEAHTFVPSPEGEGNAGAPYVNSLRGADRGVRHDGGALTAHQHDDLARRRPRRARSADHQQRRRALLLDGLVVVVAVAATLLNPYGWDMWTFLARTLVPRPEIVEWQAVPIQSRQGVAYLLVVALGLFGLWSQSPRRRVLTAPLLIAGILLPLTARRHLPLLIIIVLFTCAGDAARALGAIVARRWPRMERQPASNRMRPIIAAALILESLVVLALARTEWTRIDVDRAGYPIAAVQRLARLDQPANVAVFFDWGEYVLWHAGPRIKVSLDGRRETVYPDPVYAANGAFTDGIGDWDRLLRNYPTDLALVDVDTPAASLMALKPDWELIVRDGPAALYARRGSSLAAALHAIDDVEPVGPQLPGEPLDPADPAYSKKPPLAFP